MSIVIGIIGIIILMALPHTAEPTYTEQFPRSPVSTLNEAVSGTLSPPNASSLYRLTS